MSLNLGLKKGFLAKCVRAESEIRDYSQMADMDSTHTLKQEKKIQETLYL